MIIPILLSWTLAAAAAVDDPPEWLSTPSKVSWITSACKWQIEGGPAGWQTTRDRRECLALVKWSVVTADLDETVPRETRDQWRERATLIFSSDDGSSEACRLVPVRAEYRPIAWRDLTAALGTPGFDGIAARLNENVTEQCSPIDLARPAR